jgi:hypothetical protein
MEYSYNKFHATLTTRAQNTIAQNTICAPTCVPETRFCCLKICGWDSGQPFVKSPGSSNTRPPCTYMKGKFPTPVNCLSGKFPGVSRGGGMVTPGIDSCISALIFPPGGSNTYTRVGVYSEHAIKINSSVFRLFLCAPTSFNPI